MRCINIGLLILFCWSLYYLNNIVLTIGSDVNKQSSYFMTPNDFTELVSNKSVVHEDWLKYKTEKWIKHCASYYTREPCTRHFENYICHKYKFHFHGSLNVPCTSNKNTSLIWNSRGWYSLLNNKDCYVFQYTRGYIKEIITDEHYFLHNITQERLNDFFKFKETLNNLCLEYKNSELPCCKGNCNIRVKHEGHNEVLNYEESCGHFYNKLVYKNETFYPIYKNVTHYNFTKNNILMVVLNMPLILCSVIICLMTCIKIII